MLSIIAETIARCDGMLMIGGGDVSPSKYGATEWARLFGVNEFVDDFENGINKTNNIHFQYTFSICIFSISNA